MATLKEAYDDEVKRMRDTYGPDAEVPHSPYGQIRGGMPTVLLSNRIAELAKQVSDAGQELEMAREQFNRAQDARATAEKVFIDISERLMQAIHEHREGTPVGVPYPS